LRTDSTTKLRAACKEARNAVLDYDFLAVSAIFAFLPGLESLIERKKELGQFRSKLHQSVEAFVAAADEVPVFLSQRDVDEMGRKSMGKSITQQVKSAKNAKKRQKVKDKRAKERAAGMNFNGMWKLAREEVKKLRAETRNHLLLTLKDRKASPSRFQR
jgi:hypothetical protein